MCISVYRLGLQYRFHISHFSEFSNGKNIPACQQCSEYSYSWDSVSAQPVFQQSQSYSWASVPTNPEFQLSKCSNRERVPAEPEFQMSQCSSWARVPAEPVFQLSECFNWARVSAEPEYQLSQRSRRDRALPMQELRSDWLQPELQCMGICREQSTV